MKCPICDSNGTLHEVQSNIVAHPLPGVSINVALPFLECSNCGEEVAPPGQIKKHGEAIKQAKLKWLAENIENNECIPVILKELRSLLGVTQQQLSELIGATGNSVSKYEIGSITPTSMAKVFIALLAVQPSNFEILKSIHKHQQQSRRKTIITETRFFAIDLCHEPAPLPSTWAPVTVTTIANLNRHIRPRQSTATSADVGYINLATEWESTCIEDGETTSPLPPMYPGFFNSSACMN